ncbi:aspartate kinase [Aerococcaceae bacterium DSM 111021]|nr:aspartate kinase [Aerococcaceae bacterium DSM 111021]
MKVAKFGGSSLSSSVQIKKVSNIIMNDSDIHYVVVSAPGKRDDKDIKVTDLLIALHTNHTVGLDTTNIEKQIIERYQHIAEELNVDVSIIKHFSDRLHNLLETIDRSDRLLDALKSCGEDFNAQLISQHFNNIGLNAEYKSPEAMGIYVTDEPGNAQLLKESYDKIAEHKESDKVLVIPGFFGVSKRGDIVTFSRGGSDITGAIIARGVEAEIYENYTDQSHIFSAHPGIVDNPHAINEITYREMRELAYSGFGIFHDEALTPLYEVRIPIQIKNTNAPEIVGTKIVVERGEIKQYPVIGVSGDEGFISVTIKRYLLNREIGYTRRLLQIFEDHDLNVEHIPTGIDDISVVMRANQFENNNKLEELLEDIEQQFEPEWIHVERDLAIIAIVGEGMRDTIGIANKATAAFAESNISLRMINQGASEISMFFAIPSEDLKKGLNNLYLNYFEK